MQAQQGTKFITLDWPPPEDKYVELGLALMCIWGALPIALVNSEVGNLRTTGILQNLIH